MIPLVLVIDTFDDTGPAATARARRIEALGERVDDLVVLAAQGSAPADRSFETQVVGASGSFYDALAERRAVRGPGVMVVDGDLALLERVSSAARAFEHRILWSVDREPSVAAAERAGDVADGALVASSAWFPRRVGMRSWVVRPRGAGDLGAPSEAVPPWPPDPSAWADRVVLAAHILAPAQEVPAAADASDTAIDAGVAATATAAAERLPVAPSNPTVFEPRRRGRIALLAAAVVVLVLGLMAAAITGLRSSDGSDSKRRDTAGVDGASTGGAQAPSDPPPSTRGDQPDGGRTGETAKDGANERQTTSTTRPRGGAGSGSTGVTGSGSVGNPNPATGAGTNPTTNPTTAPTTPPTTTPPPPPTTIPPPPPTTAPPPPPTTAPPPPPTTAPPPPPTKPPPPTLPITIPSGGPGRR